MRLFPLYLLLGGCLAAGSLSGCGASGSAASTLAGPPPGAAVSGPALDRAAVSRELGNGFRAALARLAVLEQASPESSSLADDLPTGMLQDVGCRDVPRPSARRRWDCTVSWRAPVGGVMTIRYAVRVERGTCYAAVARPQRPTRYDRNAQSYTEDPLNVVSSARRGC